MHAFRDVEIAAYCPRKLYYRRRDGDPDRPEGVGAVRELAFRYERLLDGDAALRAAPIEVAPDTFRERLRATKSDSEAWPGLADPPSRDVFLQGKDCRGIAHKVVEDPLAPSLCFAGEPPESGVWEPQTARLVAAASALAWERERPVSVAFAEYPAHGVIRRVPLTARRKGIYRRALRTAASIDGPPPRVENDAKCDPCEYRADCGTRTRSLGSVLDL